MKMQEHKLISPSDIAEIAGVSRAAVSNWRKPARNMDFPEPASGTAERPLFDYDEVMFWLKKRNIDIKVSNFETSLWALMNESRGVIEPEAFCQLVMSVLCIRKIASEHSRAEEVWSQTKEQLHLNNFDSLRSLLDELNKGIYQAARKISENVKYEGKPTTSSSMLVWWKRISDFSSIRDIDSLDHSIVERIFALIEESSSLDFLDIADKLLNKISSFRPRGGAEFGSVGSNLSKLLAQLALAHNPSGRVYDPACGIGETLFNISKAAPKMFINGNESNINAITCLQQRFFLAGYRGDFQLVDSINSGDTRLEFKADVVVAESPLGSRYSESINPFDSRWVYGVPKGQASDAAWIQEAIAHLEDDGEAYVITSGRLLFGQGISREIRTKLVSQGCVKAIVELPSRIADYTAVGLFLWVLRNPLPSAETVRLIDARDVNPEDVSIIVEAVQGENLNLIEMVARMEELSDFQTETFENESDFDITGLASYSSISSHYVALNRILAKDTILIPRLWSSPEETDKETIARDYFRQGRSLANASNAFNSLPVREPEKFDFSYAKLMTVKELMKINISLRTGSVKPGKKGVVDEGIITPRVIREGVVDSFVGFDYSDVSENDSRTQAGDILVTTIGKIHATVDKSGGRLASNQVTILRLSQEKKVLLPEFVAACLEGSWNGKFLSGATIQRAKVEDLEIPLPPLEIQKEIVATLEEINRAKESVKAVLETADAFAMSLLNAARYNVNLRLENTGTTKRQP